MIVPPPLSGASADPCAWPRFLNLAIFTSAPTLVAHACGGFASAIEAMNDTEVVASVMGALVAVYPSSAAGRQPLAFAISRWGSDPWSLGSDSFYAVGSSPIDRATLAEPCSGSFIFAGEAASVLYPASVHGALLSGQDAAQRVLDSIQLPADCIVGSSPAMCSAGGTGTQGVCVDACYIMADLPPAPPFPPEPPGPTAPEPAPTQNQ